MKNTTKRIICVVTALLLTMITVAAALSLTFATIFSITTKPSSFDESFLNGEFTRTISLTQVEFNLFSAVSQAGNFKYLSYIIRHQNYVFTVEKNKESIQEYQDKINNETSESVIKNYQDRIQNAEKTVTLYQEKLNLLKADMTEADYETIDKLLQDEDFTNLLGVYYLFGNSADFFVNDTIIGIDTETSRSFGDYHVTLIIAIICGIMLTCFMITFVIFIIIYLIQAISALIRFFVHLKDDDRELVKHAQTKLIYYTLSVSSIFLIVLKIIGGTTFKLGSAFILLGSLYLASRVILAVFAMIFSEEHDVKLYVKQALALISAIVLVIASVTFMTSGFIGGVIGDADAFGETYYGEFEITENNKYAVQEKVSKAVTAGTLTVSGIALFVAIIAAYLAFIAVEKVGMQRYKTSAGIKNYSAKYILTAILLIGFIVLSTFAVTDATEQEDAFKEGTYRYLVSEYTEEGTDDYYEHAGLGLQIALIGDTIDSLKTPSSDVDPDDEGIKKTVASLEKQLDILEYQVKGLSKKTASFTTLIILTAIGFVSELCYVIVPAVIEKKMKREETV